MRRLWLHPLRYLILVSGYIKWCGCYGVPTPCCISGSFSSLFKVSKRSIVNKNDKNNMWNKAGLGFNQDLNALFFQGHVLAKATHSTPVTSPEYLDEKDSSLRFWFLTEIPQCLNYHITWSVLKICRFAFEQHILKSAGKAMVGVKRFSVLVSI